ncbi:MAG: hypothetical protein IJ521_02300, partial [Schwartzia sp.]|nr:hypothetical protein [Schwartzia sp. (in: firmicutes)]
DALYTCYGDFLCCFSKAGGMVLDSQAQGEGISDPSSIAMESSLALVSVNFLPVPFQRDKKFPFRICEIVDRTNPENSFVAHVVLRDGKEAGLFAASEQKRDHSYFSALDSIVFAFHDDSRLAMEHFDGEAYAKLFYDICLFSNPPMKLQYSPMALDAHWKAEMPEYSTEMVFGKSLLNGELTVDTVAEIESAFNDSLAVPDFKLDDAQLARLDALPPARETCILLDSEAVRGTQVFAAAQYEWEKGRTGEIFQDAEWELVSFLSALDNSMQKHGPTRAVLDCFSEMFNDLCYRKAEKLQGLEILSDIFMDSSKGMEDFCAKCHEAVGSLKSRLGLEPWSVDAARRGGNVR